MMTIRKSMTRAQVGKTVVALILALGAQSVWAAGSGTGVVQVLRTISSDSLGAPVNLVNVKISGAYSAPPPGCSVDVAPNFRLAVDTPIGRSMLATIIYAQSQGLPVNITGTGTCDTTSGFAARELVNNIAIVFP